MATTEANDPLVIVRVAEAHPLDALVAAQRAPVTHPAVHLPVGEAVQPVGPAALFLQHGVALRTPGPRVVLDGVVAQPPAFAQVPADDARLGVAVLVTLDGVLVVGFAFASHRARRGSEVGDRP